MPGADDLDRRLRAALQGVPAEEPAPGARQALLARLRRRRSRRRQVVVSGAAVVLLAVGAAAYGLSSAHQPARSAAGPSHATATTPVPQEKAGQVPSPSSRDAEPPAALSDLSCARVRVGGTPAACAGAYSLPPTFGADGGTTLGPSGAAGSSSSSAAGSSSAGASPLAATATSRAPAAPEELRVGQSIAVVLPSATGLAWGAPHVGQSTPAGAGTPSSTAVVRLVASGTGHPAGAASASFVASHQGVVVLEADAGPACGAARTPCGPAQVTWSLPVTVEGS